MFSSNRQFGTFIAVAICVGFFLTSSAIAQDSRPKTPEKKEEVEKPAEPVDEAIRIIRAFIVKNSSGDSPKINRENKSWKARLPKFPKVTTTPGKSYFWNITTNQGTVKVKFLPEIAPQHVTNFIYLTELGFFDGLNFHRVIPAFMAQGGCPRGDGRGNPGYRFAGEYPQNELGTLKTKHDRPGLLSMANAGAGTDGSQFFLTFVPTPWLDGKHTIFGEVTAGMDTLKKLEALGSPGRGAPKEPIKLVSATISVE